MAYLLLIGYLPNQQELDEFNAKIVANRNIPDKLKDFLERLPKDSHPMDVMRTITSLLGILEPENNNQLYVAIRLLSIYSPALLYWYHFSRKGIRINENTGNDSIAENFLKLYH